MEYFAYILYNESCDKFYIGSTYSIEKRLVEHNMGISDYTSKYPGEWKLAYSQVYNTRPEAIAQERYLKSLKSKIKIRTLCNISTPSSVG